MAPFRTRINYHKCHSKLSQIAQCEQSIWFWQICTNRSRVSFLFFLPRGYRISPLTNPAADLHNHNLEGRPGPGTSFWFRKGGISISISDSIPIPCLLIPISIHFRSGRIICISMPSADIIYFQQPRYLLNFLKFRQSFSSPMGADVPLGSMRCDDECDFLIIINAGPFLRLSLSLSRCPSRYFTDSRWKW